MKALMRGDSRDAKKVSVTGAGAYFVWELRKTGFGKAAVSKSVCLLECPLGELSLYSRL